MSPNFLLLKIPDFNTVTLIFSSRRQKDLNLGSSNKWWVSLKLVKLLVLPKLTSKMHTVPPTAWNHIPTSKRTVLAVVQKHHPLIPLPAKRCALGFVPPAAAWPQNQHCQINFCSRSSEPKSDCLVLCSSLLHFTWLTTTLWSIVHINHIQVNNKTTFL